MYPYHYKTLLDPYELFLPPFKITWTYKQSSGGQSRVAVERLHCNDKDVGSNPTTTRNEKRTLGGRLQKVAPLSEQDLSGRPAMLKLN